MEAFLRGALPRLLPDECSYAIHAFSGKPSLLRKIGGRLRGYSIWMRPGDCIVVIVDRDRDDCRKLKATLHSLCARAGLRTRGDASGFERQVVIRIAIEELEAWYFGDWQAVTAAYPKVSPRVPSQARYRNPDRIPNTWEAFERILQRHGYFRPGLAKTRAAAAIGAHITPSANRSHSFGVFRDAVVEAGIGARPGGSESPP